MGSNGDRVLDDEDLGSFAARGYVYVREAFPRNVALDMQERMWRELREEFSIDRNDRTTWWQPARSLRRAKTDPAQHAIASERLLGAIEDLVRPHQWPVPSNWGLVLVTFPEGPASAWTVPSEVWHWDYDLARGVGSIRDLFVFTFFSSVTSRGGGTLIVSGSHRLLERFHAELGPADRDRPPRELRKRFIRSDPWLRFLTGLDPGPKDRSAYLMNEAREVKGVPVQVVELVGDPGDAILCHPLMLHARSPNHSETPRFMRARNPLA